MVIRSKLIIRIIIAIGCVLMALSLFLAIKTAPAAYASGTGLSFHSATYNTLDTASMTKVLDVPYVVPDEGGTTAYRSGIKATFQTTHPSAAFYRFGITVDGGTEFLHDKEAVSGEFLTYSVTVSGRVVVACYLFDAQNSEIASKSVTVYSDTEGPSETVSVAEMPRWLSGGVYYVILYLNTFGDGLSGRKALYYSFQYADGVPLIEKKQISDFNSKDSEGFEITRKGTLTIYHIDNADNLTIRDYQFTKFDFTAPPTPVITATADNDIGYANGYARSFTISIDYLSDGESGIKTGYYAINGATPKQYTGPFRIATASYHEITAYSEDNAGNHSMNAFKSLTANLFDTAQPIVSELKFLVDLRKELPCTISFVATDSRSGVDYAYIAPEGTHLLPGTGNTYSLSFLGYQNTGLTVHVLDKAGNAATHQFNLSYFGQESMSALIKKYSELYRSTDFSTYSATVLADIEKKYDIFNAYLMSSTTSEQEFSAIISELDVLFSGEPILIYRVDSEPLTVSKFIEFSVDVGKISGYQKGDTVTLVLNNGTGNLSDYLTLAGYSQGFIAYFKLDVYRNDTLAVFDGEGAVTVKMNLPIGYYERKFTLIHLAGNKVLDSEVYNNLIEFRPSESGTYGLVISGNKDAAGENTGNRPSTIKVFGKDMSKGVFFGIIGGIAAGVAVVVVFLIVRMKKAR